MIEIRPASSADIEQISDVLICSIRELCCEDHHGDADLLSDWVGNKSTDDIRRWLDGPHHMRVSTETSERIGAVGMYSDQGEILLLYVHPDLRGTGHSEALLSAMELALRRNGIRQARLASTRTAHEFYKQRGWLDALDAPSNPGLPMYKTLTRI